jgi:integrase
MARVGEGRSKAASEHALQWEHVDLVAGTVTVAKHGPRRHDQKGRTRRKVPMTTMLRAALEALPTVPREGYVVRNMDGSE